MEYIHGLYQMNKGLLQERIGDRIWPIESLLCVITQWEPLVNVFDISIEGISIGNDLQTVDSGCTHTHKKMEQRKQANAWRSIISQLYRR